MFSEVDITLIISNNRNYTQTVNVMGNPYNLLDTSNAKTEYRWNITGFVFTTETDVSIQYKPIDETTILTYISNIESQTIDSVVLALNGLGIGYFNTYTELGQTYISTNNDNYFFGGLTIGGITIIDYSFITGTGFNGSVIGLTSSGSKIYVAGGYNIYDGTNANRIIKLNNDGSIDPAFFYSLGFDSFTASIAEQSDGKILVGGGFSIYNFISANRIIRLNNDGSIDPTFVYGTGFNGGVAKIVIQPDGKILIGGSFNIYNGIGASGIVRLNTDGSIDPTFVYGLGFNGQVQVITIQSDGKILVGGSFSIYNVTAVNNIVRLNSDGSIDATFVIGTGFDNGVQSILLQNDKILIGGNFNNYNGTPANYIIRLNSDGTIDPTFVYGTGFDSSVFSIAIKNDKIFVGGTFGNYNGTPANDFIKLNSDGSIDTLYLSYIGSGFGFGTVSVINIIGDTALVGGTFSSFNGVSANNIIRLLTN